MKVLVDEENFDIPMTPMLDIVFQLLIFFLLATTIQEEERDLLINLTSGSMGAEQGAAATTPLVLSVRKDGSYTLGGVVIEWGELRKRLLDAGRGKAKRVGYVRPDKGVAHEKVAQVYQLCAEAGIELHEDFRAEAAP